MQLPDILPRDFIHDPSLPWLLVATGVTGSWTLSFLLRQFLKLFRTPQGVGLYFSPKGGCTDAIVREINAARREVLVQAYSFTADPLTFALIEARKRGVDVDILLDRSNERDSYSDLKIFLDHGLVPLIDAEHAIAHNKVMIIDRRTIITGSFNFTNQAEKENAENVLILKGHTDLVRAYVNNFEAHRAHCKPPNLEAQPAPSKRAA